MPREPQAERERRSAAVGGDRHPARQLTASAARVDDDAAHDRRDFGAVDDRFAYRDALERGAGGDRLLEQRRVEIARG